MNKFEFIEQCKKNREILEYTFSDMSSCLIGVSEKEYKLFEQGKYSMSKENLERLVRVLCVKNINEFYLEDYVDTTGLREEEINDLKGIVEKLVGEVDD